MNDIKKDYYISKLDCERFGFKIAKLTNITNYNKELLNKLLIELKNKNVNLVISRVNTNNFKLINNMENIGFKLKDIQLKYKLFLKDIIKFENIEETTKIRKFKLSDLNRVEEIAGECFSNYGHYFEDEKLKKEDSLNVYKDWSVRACCKKEIADIVYIAEFENNLLGYIAMKTEESENKKYGYCVIGGVAKEARGKGIYTSLIKKTLNWGLENNLQWEEHNILINNYSVNKVLSNIGFRAKESFVTMHLWL